MTPKSLADILSIEDNQQFLDELGHVDTQHNGIDFHKRPAPFGMFGGLWALHIALAVGGVRKFLDEAEGRGFHETHIWCKRIGATRTAKYLSAVAALFPKRQVPKADAARNQITMDVEEGTARLDAPDAFTKLDREFGKDALTEIPRCLREYVNAHRGEIEEAMSSVSATHQTHGFTVKEAEDALAGLKEVGKRIQDEATALSVLAETRGKRRFDGSEDPVVATFMASLGTLSVDQWLAVCERRLALSTREVNRAIGMVASLSADMITGRLLGKKKGKLVHAAALRIRDRTAPVLAALPEAIKRKGKPFELRKIALVVANNAWQALMYFDWLIVTSNGKRAAKTLLVPFAGLTPLPPEVGLTTEQVGRQRRQR